MTYQFSLAQLLASVTLVAVLLGVLRWTWALWQASLSDQTGTLAATVLVVGAVAVVTYGISQRG